MEIAINIFFAVVTGIISLVLIILGCILLFSEGEVIGLAPLVAGLFFTLLPILIICDLTKPVEKQFAEKQQAVIEAQRELEKFLIDHPELKESKE